MEFWLSLVWFYVLVVVFVSHLHKPSYFYHTDYEIDLLYQQRYYYNKNVKYYVYVNHALMTCCIYVRLRLISIKNTM